MNHFPNSNSTSLEVQTELPLSTIAGQSNLRDSLSRFSVNAFARQTVLSKFSSLNGGRIHLVEGDNKESFGTCDQDDLQATVAVSNSAFFRKVLVGGTIGSAESYIDNDWGCDNLTGLIRIMIRNMDSVTAMEKRWARLRSVYHRYRHVGRKNTVEGSRRNIHEHYDLGNSFYQLFLDPTLNYSAGIFDEAKGAQWFPEATSQMHAASLVKMRHICERLQLKPEHCVIEIGTGWGALAIFMAEHYGCHVTTTTISQEQYRHATAAVKAKGLEDRVTVLRKDYRDLEGKFDRLVSIEMIEAVGHQFLDTYFAKCDSLLKEDGAMLIQAITISQQNDEAYRKGVDFIRAYVFPGGCLPSIGSISAAIGKSTSLRMIGLEDISQHYADTLGHWRAEFVNKLDDVRRLGFDDAFVRLWHFYLCYCEAAFAERRCNSLQVLFAKSKNDLCPAMGCGSNPGEFSDGQKKKAVFYERLS